MKINVKQMKVIYVSIKGNTEMIIYVEKGISCSVNVPWICLIVCL